MSDDRLTSEERAVLEAAQILVDSWPGDTAGMRTPQASAFGEAVTAYRKATAPPEPFERYIYRYTDGTWSTSTYEDVDDTEDIVNTWRCTVTPIERVR